MYYNDDDDGYDLEFHIKFKYLIGFFRLDWIYNVCLFPCDFIIFFPSGSIYIPISKWFWIFISLLRKKKIINFVIHMQAELFHFFLLNFFSFQTKYFYDWTRERHIQTNQRKIFRVLFLVGILQGNTIR